MKFELGDRVRFYKSQTVEGEIVEITKPVGKDEIYYKVKWDSDPKEFFYAYDQLKPANEPYDDSLLTWIENIK